ncbi:hypothetical protein [Vibrio cholerae]|uniref:hypothetical protein n=1 Tax=Vibrio cholerae TaxID=666 RepID=UPI003B52AFE7
MQFDYEVQMQLYKDIDSDSGVQGFEIGVDRITVWFNGTARPYTYSYSSAGSSHVETMKKLAVSGDGLNAYINRHVKFKYVR